MDQTDFTAKPILEFKNIAKSFGSHAVLSDVCLTALPGEVIALMGENGAGKSTLMRILSGVYPEGDYTGTILLDGKPVQFSNVADAKRAGISMVHQELGLFPELTVAENIFLEKMHKTECWRIHWKALFKDAQAFLEELKFNIPADALVKTLSTGQAQLVEIARAIHSKSKIFIFDEPTSALTESEAENLFSLIEKLRREYKTCFYVSHRMAEIQRICDRTVILRDGAIVGEGKSQDLKQDELIRLMVGRDVNQIYPVKTKKTNSHNQPILEVNNLEVCRGAENKVSQKIVEKTSFKLYPGEILGLGGLMGAGRSELALSLFGFFSNHAPNSSDHEVRGTVRIRQDTVLKDFSPRKSIDLKIAMLTEDRKGLGLFLNRPVRENMAITVIDRLGGRTKRTLINHKQEKELTQGLAKKLRVRGPSLEINVENFSGGNQQKVYLANCLALKPDILILDEPTRGVDVGAKTEIYEFIQNLSDEGVAILLISSEMPELLGLSDRVLVMKSGKIKREFLRNDHSTFDPEEILRAAAL